VINRLEGLAIFLLGDELAEVAGHSEAPGLGSSPEPPTWVPGHLAFRHRRWQLRDRLTCEIRRYARRSRAAAGRLWRTRMAVRC